MDGDFPLSPKNVEFLLPPDVFYELFSESNAAEENQSESDTETENFINTEDGVTVQSEADNNPVHHSSTQLLPVPDHQGAENDVQDVLPIQQAYTWAQIVKGEPSYTFQGPEAFFPPLMKSSGICETEGGKNEQGEKASSSK